jgi:hypothetical protein
MPIALAALMLLPVAAHAKPKWHVIFTGKGVTVAMDTAAIVRNADDSYSVWTRWDYSTARKLENKKSYTRLMEKVDLKCGPVVLKRLNTSLYNKAGKVVKEPDEVSAEERQAMTWDPPRPGSDGEKVFAAACKALEKKKPKMR